MPPSTHSIRTLYPAGLLLEPNDFADVTEVARTLNAFEHHWSSVAEPFDWRFTRDDLSV